MHLLSWIVRPSLIEFFKKKMNRFFREANKCVNALVRKGSGANHDLVLFNSHECMLLSSFGLYYERLCSLNYVTVANFNRFLPQKNIPRLVAQMSIHCDAASLIGPKFGNAFCFLGGKNPQGLIVYWVPI